MMDNRRNHIQWIPVIELAVLAFTTLGTTITLFLHSDSKIDEFRRECLENRKETNVIMYSIQQEMKDFHGRMERQDAEFKAHIMNQRETSGGK